MAGMLHAHMQGMLTNNDMIIKCFWLYIMSMSIFVYEYQ